MTTHECGCSFFGPGPHSADARHRNARGCEHAEDELRKVRDHIAALVTPSEGWHAGMIGKVTALAIIDAALGAAQEKGT